MKKLLYSGLMALMMLFAFGSAKAQDDTPQDKVKVTLSSTTWTVGSEDAAPTLTVAITAAEGADAATAVLGTETGNFAVEVTFQYDEESSFGLPGAGSDVDDIKLVLTQTTTTLDVSKFTAAGYYDLKYRLVKGDEQTVVFDGAATMGTGSTSIFTVENPNAVAAQYTLQVLHGVTGEPLSTEESNPVVLYYPSINIMAFANERVPMNGEFYYSFVGKGENAVEPTREAYEAENNNGKVKKALTQTDHGMTSFVIYTDVANAASVAIKGYLTPMDLGEGGEGLRLLVEGDDEAGDNTEIVTTTYAYDLSFADEPAEDPVFAPAAPAQIASGDTVRISNFATIYGNDEMGSVYYSLNGTTPLFGYGSTNEGATAGVFEYDTIKGIVISGNVGDQVTITAIAYAMDAEFQMLAASTIVTSTYTIKSDEDPDQPTAAFTFNPAAESELEENAQINITWSGSNFDIISFKWFATKEAADADETKVGSAAGWTEYAVQNASKIPVFTAANPVLKVIVTNDDEEFLADTVVVYTLKTTPVDPDKLDVKIEFMTDAYGQARFAKKSDKIRLYMEDPDAVDSMMYAVVAIDADGEETAAATYAKYGEALISLADVEGNFRVKAYAMKDTKTSDVFNADYVLLDIINPTLTFDTMTGKNYPVAFDVHSISYPDIMEKDMYVYYSVDGTTEPSDTAFLNGNTALTYLNREEGLWKNFLNLQENTTVWAKAYVLLDEGANLVMETPAVKQLVKMNTLANPVITPAIAATEYNAGDSIKVAIQMPEGAEVVYYTVDGSEPLYSRLVENERLADSIIFMYESWMDHFDTIVVKKSTTIKAIAYKEPAYRPFEPAAGSDIVSATYGFKATLSFNPTSGSTVEEGTKVAITSEDETIDIFYMMFESEEAAKAAEWDQEKAESYNNELQPVLTPKNNTIKAAYARHGAEAIVENYFYATYTVTELPDITLTFNPASGSEVKDSTEITVTASRETEIFYLVYADSAASVADTLFDRNAKEVAENGKPMITKGNTFLKCAVYNKGAMKYFYASYTVKEEGPTAIEAGELAGVNVYPNPNAGAFNVAVPERARIDIFGLNGAKVMSREVNAGVEAFNLDHSGIYFIRVMAGNKTAVKRVVVR